MNSESDSDSMVKKKRVDGNVLKLKRKEANKRLYKKSCILRKRKIAGIAEEESIKTVLEIPIRELNSELITEDEPGLSNLQDIYSETDEPDRSDSDVDDNSDYEETEIDCKLYEFSNITVKEFLVTINLMKLKHSLSKVAIQHFLSFIKTILPQPNKCPKGLK